MLGQRVGGFEVKSILGGGRRTLYLAVNLDTGHRAAVRALGEDDTGAAFTDFAREVAEALALTRRPEVVTRTLDDGREVLLALVDPDAPGSGATRFAATTRIERPPQKVVSRRWVPLVLLALLAGSLVALGLWRRSLAVAPVVAQPVVVAPVVLQPVVAAPVVAAAPEAPEPSPVPARPLTPTLSPLRREREVQGRCDVSDEWKKHRLADLRELDDRVQRSETLWQLEQPKLDQLSVLIARARDPNDCRAVEAELKRLIARIIGN